MVIKEVGRSGGEYTANLKCASVNKVILAAKSANSDRIVNGLILPSSIDKNERLHVYQITDISKYASEQTGVVVGDFVLVDMLARFYDTFPVSVVSVENIVCKCSNYEMDNIQPLNNQIFVEQEPVSETDISGLKILTDLTATGIITAINKTDIKRDCFNIGDRILLTKCDIFLMYRNKKIFIYNSENIIAKIKD